MVRELGPKKRFSLLLIGIYAVSIPLVVLICFVVLRQNAVREVNITGRLYLATVGAVKHYVSEELRPVFYREMPGRFIVQGMSRSFTASRVAAKVQMEMPNYEYKNASLNPTNPMNEADDFEKGIIRRFAGDRTLREWSGFRTRGGVELYSIAKAGDPFTADCLKCHGNPADAPAEFRERYGDKRGFHARVGDLLDATFVYIPVRVPLAEARKITALFAGVYMLFGALILAIVIRRFSGLYNRIEDDRQRIEDTNLELMNLNQDMESIISERTMNLIALSVADRVRNPATTIAATFSRILRKEALSDQLRERIGEIVAEAGKLDSIVRDYEAVLKKKRAFFKLEDLNEIVTSVLPLIDADRRSKNIHIMLNLSSDPKTCMASRQMLRVVILHILRNAVESVAEYGEVVITTSSADDHVLLEVKDNGVGIPPEDLPKIFNLFFSSKKQRIGLGLPLARQIVEEHKGDIWVVSEPGKGTTFTLSFPVRWSEQELSK